MQCGPISRKTTIQLIVAVLAWLMVGSQAHAHLVLAKPQARSNDNDLIRGPCGGRPKGAPTANYPAGSTVEVTIDLNVRHVDTLQVVISYDNFEHSAVLTTIPTIDAGIYNASVRIPGHTVGPAVLQATDGQYVSCADIMVSGTPVFPINAGISDAWFTPQTDGQGFFIIVYPQLRQLFLAWFTFDTDRPPEELIAVPGDPGHRWLTALGSYVDDRAGLDLVVTSGGTFDRAMPTVMNSAQGTVGTLQLEFESCTSGVIRYSLIEQDLMNELPIQRIVDDKVALCETLQLESK